MPTLTIDGAEHLLEGECTLGRHRSCGIQVKDEAASRQHAKVFSADGLWWVEDLGSANGTNLNGTAITGRKRLRDKDAISIGKTVIRFAEGAQDSATGEVAAGKRAAPTGGRDVTGLAGSRIAGYRIDRYLGRGMLGAVYQGHQLNLDRAVAFKVFDPERCVRDAGLAKRFLVEAGKVGSVTHDGLVQLHESGEHEGLLWCSMEWVEGDTLETRLKDDGRIDPALAFLITEKIAEALAAAHTQGVIHGDLRPSHVIVMGDGRIRLTDVGMMGIFEEAELPSSGTAALAWYLSPEEAAEGASDPRSDIYSLGCLLFHLLAGKPPFDGADTGAVIAAHAKQPIPSLKGTGAKVDIAAVDALIQGMLAKNPGWRHASMDEVIAEIRPLREAAAGRPADEAPRPILRRSSEIHAPSTRVAAPRHPVRTALLWVLAVVALCLVAALVLPHLKQVQAPEPVVPPPPAPIVDVRPTTHPVTVVQPPVPVQVPPVASGESPAVAAWKQVQAAVAQAQQQNEWSNAEQALVAFAAQAKADPAVARAVAERQQQLAGDGDQWYQEELAKVAKGDAPADIAERLRGIDRLRDVVLADNRPDAESRYQEALTRLGQRLNVAKRQARQAIETGRVLDLPKIASDLAPAFAQTPVTDLHRQFSLLCNEAAGIKPVWATSWAVTRPKLLAAKGADALAAAAALLLAGDTAEAKALLANDPALANGELLRRREAIFGRKAAVLTFDDPDDLQYIEVVAGEPRMAAGTLTAAPGEPVILSCSAPIGAVGWDVAIGLALEQARADGQAAVSLARGENADVQVRIEKDAVHARVRTAGGWQETRAPRPETKVLRLRLAERGGTVTVFVNDQAVLTAPQAKVAAGSALRFESTGMVWGMTDLQVVGGE